MSMSLRDGICIYSKTPDSLFETMVRTAIGEYIHTASTAFLHANRAGSVNSELNRVVFFTLMGENFEFKVMNPHDESMDDCYTVQFIPTSEQVSTSYMGYMNYFANRKIPYNYSDLVLCLTKGGGMITDAFCADVEVSAAKTVFCSQAVVLALRTALLDHVETLCDTEIKLLQALTKCNSRATDPTKLFTVLNDHATCYDMRTFRVMYWK